MKYILYKTTNLVNSFIYIGVHKTQNPDIFDSYLGNGIYANRPHTYIHSKTNFQQAVKQFGVNNFKREVLAVYNTADEAYLAESLIVNEEFLARDDVYNMILGGDYKLIKSIKCFQYDLNGNYIQEFESITEASQYIGMTMCAVWNAIQFKQMCANFYWSTDKLEKIDINLYAKSPKPIKIYRYKVSGEFDKEFDSLTSASKDDTLIQIARSARLGYRVGIYQYSFIKAESYDKAKSIYLKSRPVFKYDSSGNFIKGYETQKEAEWENPNSNITKSIKNKKPCDNGFLWGLEKLDKYCSTKTKKKPVGMYSLDGTLLKEWDCVKNWKLDYNISTQYVKFEKIYKKENVIFKFI